MLSRVIKISFSVILFISAILLFIKGFILFGILAMLISLLFLLFYFRHENMLLAFFYIRKGKLDQALFFLNKIKTPEKTLIKKQVGYYYFLLGACQAQTNMLGAEKYFKKALLLGLRLDMDHAVAKLNLAAIAMSKGNKREAQNLLNDAKKMDKRKMLIDQIKMMQEQMGKVGMQKVGMQNHHGRKRMFQ